MSDEQRNAAVRELNDLINAATSQHDRLMKVLHSALGELIISCPHSKVETYPADVGEVHFVHECQVCGKEW